MSSVPRFFVPPEAVQGDVALLPAEVAHHAITVLRLRLGDPLILHDGLENAYECRLTEANSKRAMVVVEATYRLHTEPKRRVTIAQALPKTSDKIEQVLQHGTEVGAGGFVLFTGFRSVARLAKGEKVEKRLSRWEAIVQGAAEQSRRGVLPTVAWLPFASDVAATFPQYECVLVLQETSELPLKEVMGQLPETTLQFLVLVGPEGGFTDDEIGLFAVQGATLVTLGPRILRTETAALVALAQMV
jgi:16S rRNA (uracil1498-N3)-methyltransferase